MKSVNRQFLWMLTSVQMRQIMCLACLVILILRRMTVTEWRELWSLYHHVNPTCWLCFIFEVVTLCPFIYKYTWVKLERPAKSCHIKGKLCGIWIIGLRFNTSTREHLSLIDEDLTRKVSALLSDFGCCTSGWCITVAVRPPCIRKPHTPLHHSGTMCLNTTACIYQSINVIHDPKRSCHWIRSQSKLPIQKLKQPAWTAVYIGMTVTEPVSSQTAHQNYC